MGGAPSIQGGMSAAEYDSMLTKQAEIAKEAEATRQKNLLEYEKTRKENEAAQLQAMKDAERLAVEQQQAAESEIASEIEAQESTQGLTQDQIKKLTDTYGSLYQGLENFLQRPQG
jgi:hypothetical protein